MGRREGEEGPQRDTTNDTTRGRCQRAREGIVGGSCRILWLSRERTGAIWGEWLGRDAFVRAEDDTRGG